MKIAARAWSTPVPFETLLFDLARPKRQRDHDAAIERQMIAHMMVGANDAPLEQYERLGLPQPVSRVVAFRVCLTPSLAALGPHAWRAAGALAPAVVTGAAEQRPYAINSQIRDAPIFRAWSGVGAAATISALE